MKLRVLALIVLIMSGCGQAKPTMPNNSADPSPEPISWKADPVMAKALKGHVDMLADTIGARNIDRPESYKWAERYLTEELTKMGYQVQRQTYSVEGYECANLWTEKKGEGGTLVIGAHYDSCDQTPGADDNASGCAALLELARLIKDEKTGPTVRFVLFANEEPPYFMNDTMGSLVYAKSCQAAGEKFLGMISLECVGYFSDEPNSQHFPTGVTGYPDTGNFAGFVSDLGSKAFMQQCLAGFKVAKSIHAEGLAAPGLVEGVNWSDHWSFTQCGYSAAMLTDTALFRNQNYHMSTDLPSTLDYERMAAVVVGARSMVLSFAPR